MRFLVTLILLLWAAGTSVGHADDLEKALGEAGKPGSPEYREYLRKKAAREKALLPIKEELQRCLKDEKADPSLALLAFEKIMIPEGLHTLTRPFLSPETGTITGAFADHELGRRYTQGAQLIGMRLEDMKALHDRSTSMGFEIRRYLEKLGGRGEQMPCTAVGIRFSLYDRVAAMSDPESRIIYYSDYVLLRVSRGIVDSWLQDRNLERQREHAVEDISDRLNEVMTNPPDEEAHSLCHLFWENKLLHTLRQARQWNCVPEELGLTDLEYQDIQDQAKTVATRHAKSLLAELRSSPPPQSPVVVLARDYKLKQVLAFVSLSELGTTPTAVASLMNRLEKHYGLSR